MEIIRERNPKPLQEHWKTRFLRCRTLLPLHIFLKGLIFCLDVLGVELQSGKRDEVPDLEERVLGDGVTVAGRRAALVLGDGVVVLAGQNEGEGRMGGLPVVGGWVREGGVPDEGGRLLVGGITAGVG